MTPKERAAMQQALEALEEAYENGFLTGIAGLKTIDVITALREALAEQAEQEPVAWMQEMPTRGNEIRSVRMTTIEKFAHEEWVNPIPLYAAPVRTKDLTDDEIFQFQKEIQYADVDPITFARAVIAADREKNK